MMMVMLIMLPNIAVMRLMTRISIRVMRTIRIVGCDSWHGDDEDDEHHDERHRLRQVKVVERWQ